MKRMKTLLVAALVALGMSIPAFAAPTQTTMTTLSAAVTAAQNTITVASATGISASTTSGTPSKTFVLVDSELMQITAIASTTLTVTRAQDNTVRTSHLSGAYVIYGTFAANPWIPANSGSPTFGVFLDKGYKPQGSCTRSSQQYSPMFLIESPTVNGGYVGARVYDCVGGLWRSGDWPVIVDVTAIRKCTIETGSLALTAYGTDATRVAGTIYRGSIDIPATRVVVLLSSLTGTTAPTTDKQIFAIYDSVAGTTAANTIATTALAGVAAATADIFFDQNLTTPVVLVPGRYFLALQMEGTTTSIQAVATGTGYVNLVGSSSTGTFGTLGAITIPTTLTTSTSPIMCVG